MGKNLKDDFVSLEYLFSNKDIDRYYQKLNNDQKEYYHALLEKDVVFVDAPSGTGKTTIAVMAGLHYLRQGKQLIYIRFPSKRGEKLGFTPGDLDDKEEKYMYPFYEAMEEFGIGKALIKELMFVELIDLRTDVTERGRNLKNAFVICPKKC